MSVTATDLFCGAGGSFPTAQVALDAAWATEQIDKAA